MARKRLTPAQRRTLAAEADDRARQATEAVLSQALDRLCETLDLWDYTSPHSERMAKVVEKTARKVLKAFFNGETRGRKKTVRLGFFTEQYILRTGADLARGGIGATKGAEIIFEELKERFEKAKAALKAKGKPADRKEGETQLPTVSAIKGYLERSKRQLN